MKSACLISIALLGQSSDANPLQPSSPQISTQQAQTDDTEQALTPDQLREAYRLVVRSSAKRAKPDPAVVVPQLAVVYIALANADGIEHGEIVHMRKVMKARLEQFRDRLLRDQFRETRARSSQRQTPRVPKTANRTTELAGGTEWANASDLIALIQSVIEPEHWDVNGGPGRISYFPPVHALVVRARGGVHEQIGSTLGQIRRQQ